MATLSVVLATFNEEKNLADCLASVRDIADEIIIVDGTSTDKTVETAKQFDAKVIVTDNPPIFHINKQKAIDLASKEWILQLDADERVSELLRNEIMQIIAMSNSELEHYEQSLQNRKLFLRHQKLLEERDGQIGSKEGDYTAFFIPRKNYFLGRYLTFGGVYPDGVIRLFKKGKAYLPAKDVHEQMVVDGKVGWLEHALLHMDSPTFSKYIKRWNRYTDLLAADLKKQKIGMNPFTIIKYLFILPGWWFLTTYVRHKGFLDGWQGFLFSYFSSLRFPVALVKYLLKHDN